MELSEEEKQRQLFGSLLGFKIGDRVKTREKTCSWRKGKSHYYWRYGIVIALRKRKPWDNEDRVRVLFSGDGYALTIKVSRLVRCRKYVKKSR